MMASRVRRDPSPPILLPEVVHNIAPHLAYPDLLRFLTCCRELYAYKDFDLDVSSEILCSSEALSLAWSHIHRFRFHFAVDRCNQQMFDSLMSLPMVSLVVRPPTVEPPLRAISSVGMCKGLRQLRLLYSTGSHIDDLSPLAQVIGFRAPPLSLSPYVALTAWLYVSTCAD